MPDIEDDGFVTVHHSGYVATQGTRRELIEKGIIQPRPKGRWCRICLRHEVQPDGWCFKCGSKTAEAIKATPDQVTEILREACNIIADEVDGIRAGIEIIGTGKLSTDPRDAHAVARVKELEDWIARAGAILIRRDALHSAAVELVDRDVQYHGSEIRIPAASHADAIRMVAQLRAAANLTNPSEARADE